MLIAGVKNPKFLVGIFTQIASNGPKSRPVLRNAGGEFMIF